MRVPVPGKGPPLVAWIVGASILVSVVRPSGLCAQLVAGTLVDDDTGRGIAEARITLLRLDSIPQRYTITDSLGNFVLRVGQLGDYMLKAERYGYQTTVSQSFPVAMLDTTRVQFFVSRDAILLAPLNVQVRPVQGEELFARRKALGKGVLLDPTMVDSLRPKTHPAEILKHVDDVRVRWRWGYKENGGNGPMPYVGTYLGQGCVNYIVDHTPVPDPWFTGVGVWGVSPLAELTPDDLVAVEVYRHISEVPEDFVTQLVADTYGKRKKLREMQRSTCGIIIFWTKRGW